MLVIESVARIGRFAAAKDLMMTAGARRHASRPPPITITSTASLSTSTRYAVDWCAVLRWQDRWSDQDRSLRSPTFRREWDRDLAAPATGDRQASPLPGFGCSIGAVEKVSRSRPVGYPGGAKPDLTGRSNAASKHTTAEPCGQPETSSTLLGMVDDPFGPGYRRRSGMKQSCSCSVAQRRCSCS